MRRPMRLMGLMRLIGLMGLMGLMGCSKEQAEPEPELQEVITFSGSLQGATEVVAGTRAEGDTPLSNLTTTFQVWAFKNKSYAESAYGSLQEVMHDYTVSWAANTANTTTTNSSGWEYVDGVEQTIKYWDLDAKAYKFFGYVPAKKGDVVVEFYHEANGAYEVYGANGSIADYSSCRLSYAADVREETVAPYFTRLWFSNNSLGSEYFYPSMVRLQFFQPFAKVRFMFKHANPDEPMLIELPHFFPATVGQQIPMSGTFHISYPLTGTETKESWTTDGITYALAAFTQEWYTLTDEEEAEASAEKIANKEHWYTVLPTRNQGAYNLTVRVDGEERICTVPGEYMDWNPGYSYTYIFKVNEDGGVEFDAINVAYTDWLGNTAQTKIIYNW